MLLVIWQLVMPVVVVVVGNVVVDGVVVNDVDALLNPDVSLTLEMTTFINLKPMVKVKTKSQSYNSKFYIHQSHC